MKKEEGIPQLLKSKIFSTIGMTVHREDFGVKFAQATLEQILHLPSQQKPVIPTECYDEESLF
jgi:hypothetical protein